MKRGHDLNYVVTLIDPGRNARCCLSTVIDETACDVASAFGWPLATAKRGLL